MLLVEANCRDHKIVIELRRSTTGNDYSLVSGGMFRTTYLK